jgi:hypothetical protein
MTRSHDDYDEEDLMVINATTVTETAAAVLLNVDGEKIWFPKSQIAELGPDDWSIPRWLAEEKGVA